MLLHEYLDGIQSIIEGYSRARLILASDVSSDFRTEKIGIIRGTIDFIDESSLHFTEYLDLRYGIEKLTYSFHYQDRDGKLICRYDNARHKPAYESQADRPGHSQPWLDVRRTCCGISWSGDIQSMQNA